ncbi:U-box domain-containing protein 14 [Striga hermonthica]|uniref:RING-type E3 ubiquitin transferase n=1 Tax=Striga hermonthica TaxID=68872 RepID=A0A9N7N303_STRHE|nr:U-box domain-containing protein 14 [Striga hermonthica]
MMGESTRDEALLGQLSESVREIYELPECRTVSRKMYCNLVRRVKLLSPLFEELKDVGEDGELGDDVVRGLESLRIALDSALELLKSVHKWSKIFQALQVEKIAAKFEDVTQLIEASLCQIPYNKLDIPDEVREQIELLHHQFKRAIAQTESPDLQLVVDLAAAQMEDDPEPSVFRRLSEKLFLRTTADIKRELLAIHEMVILCGGVPEGVSEEYIETMSYLLRKIKDCVMMDGPENDATEFDKNSIKHRSPIIPDDFRCPISLELMKDPVIVSTGQTYERSCIQKWLDAGHKTCPKTQQTLSHTSLTPNYVLKSLISLWCETNGVELPLPHPPSAPLRRRPSDCDRLSVDSLLRRLSDHSDPDRQRAAAGELRLLSKRNAGNRVCLASAGVIPLLADLLSSPDPRAQEHAVTALLNLSINDANKGAIVNSGAIPDIVAVLRSGSPEARENAAAALFSLSAVDENKVAIGAAGAVGPLVDLLRTGTPRGRKDAATAIFNLCIYGGNKARAVRAGVVGPLMGFLRDPGGGMADEALAILAILAGHPEGRAGIAGERPGPELVEVVRTGSPRNRENAAAVLWALCAGGDGQWLKGEEGAEEALRELAENGTDRAKRKAVALLELLNRAEDTVGL